MAPAEYTPLICSLASLPHPFIPTMLEQLMGKPITRFPSQKPHKSRSQIMDDLLAQIELKKTRGDHISSLRFCSVKPNPYQPGSLRHERYSLIREYMTIGEYLNKGGRKRDIVRGVKHGDFYLDKED
jgi:hypothetical protein